MQKESICDNEKKRVRAELKARRDRLADKPRLSALACDRLIPLLSGSVMVYVSIGSELDTSALIDRLFMNAEITLYAPYTVDGVIYPLRLVKFGKPDRTGNLPIECYDSDDFSAVFGSNGNRMPKIDCCITPFLGINGDGYRIGYGKGCYDRFFGAASVARKIGLAFDCQICDFTPESRDVPLDCCVFDTKVVYFEHNASDCG